MAQEGAFITGVDAGRPSSSSARRPKEEILPARILSDNAKLTDVVDAFRSKVDLMVNKQKGEYEEAYAFHMEGVQKELHFLREKAKEIANDKTKEEKINQLDNNQKFYSAESVRLDAEVNELRKKLRSLAGTVHVVERERDWLLGKLRMAKDEYRRLNDDRTRIMDTYGASLGGSVLSEDSSLTLEVIQNSRHAKNNNTAQTGNVARRTARNSHATPAGGLPPLDGGSSPEDPEVLGLKRALGRLDRELHHSKSTLVNMKSKQEALRKFVEHCHDEVGKGQWDKYFRTDSAEFTPSVASAAPPEGDMGGYGDGEQLDKRPVPEVLDDCTKAVSVQDQDGADVLRRMLAVELCLIPETFETILAMLSDDPMRAGGGPELVTSAFGQQDAAAATDGTLYDLVGPVASSPEKLLVQAEREWAASQAPGAAPNPWGEDSTASEVGLARDISTYLQSSLDFRNKQENGEED